jgi:hypothetical protein
VPRQPVPPGPIAALAIAAALLAMLLATATLTRFGAARRWVVLTALMGVVTIAGIVATGCSSASQTLVGGTPASTSKITVTVTSGALSHAITVTLNVQ